MNKIKCFEVAVVLLEEAAKRFKPIWKLNPEGVSSVKKGCSIIDSIAEDFEGTSFDVEIDETAMNISIVLECDKPIEEKHLYQIEEYMGKFKLLSEKDKIVKFTFDNIWERVI